MPDEQSMHFGSVLEDYELTEDVASILDNAVDEGDDTFMSF